MKPITKRIQYYTRKVAQYSALHTAHIKPPWYKRRYQRLLAYKARMHELIAQECGK